MRAPILQKFIPIYKSREVTEEVESLIRFLIQAIPSGSYDADVLTLFANETEATINFLEHLQDSGDFIESRVVNGDLETGGAIRRWRNLPKNTTVTVHLEFDVNLSTEDVTSASFNNVGDTAPNWRGVTDDRTSISSPADGDIVYESDGEAFYTHNGTEWSEVSDAASVFASMASFTWADITDEDVNVGVGLWLGEVANEAARLSLSPTESDMCYQISTDNFWEYDETTSVWTERSIEYYLRNHLDGDNYGSTYIGSHSVAELNTYFDTHTFDTTDSSTYVFREDIQQVQRLTAVGEGSVVWLGQSQSDTDISAYFESNTFDSNTLYFVHHADDNEVVQITNLAGWVDFNTYGLGDINPSHFTLDETGLALSGDGTLGITLDEATISENVLGEFRIRVTLREVDSIYNIRQLLNLLTRYIILVAGTYDDNIPIHILNGAPPLPVNYLELLDALSDDDFPDLQRWDRLPTSTTFSVEPQAGTPNYTWADITNDDIIGDGVWHGEIATTDGVTGAAGDLAWDIGRGVLRLNIGSDSWTVVHATQLFTNHIGDDPGRYLGSFSIEELNTHFESNAFSTTQSTYIYREDINQVQRLVSVADWADLNSLVSGSGDAFTWVDVSNADIRHNARWRGEVADTTALDALTGNQNGDIAFKLDDGTIWQYVDLTQSYRNVTSKSGYTFIDHIGTDGQDSIFLLDGYTDAELSTYFETNTLSTTQSTYVYRTGTVNQLQRLTAVSESTAPYDSVSGLSADELTITDRLATDAEIDIEIDDVIPGSGSPDSYTWADMTDSDVRGGNWLGEVADETARLALSPSNGDLCYQLDTDALWLYFGTSWDTVTSHYEEYFVNHLGSQDFHRWLGSLSIAELDTYFETNTFSTTVSTYVFREDINQLQRLTAVTFTQTLPEGANPRNPGEAITSSITENLRIVTALSAGDTTYTYRKKLNVYLNWSDLIIGDTILGSIPIYEVYANHNIFGSTELPTDLTDQQSYFAWNDSNGATAWFAWTNEQAEQQIIAWS